ncbi:hypothetical protein F0L68_02235 [Solihabitans fulvus]|uniref:PH domain-containing protein n=1 Tax=Solihabitans fulvus TaxID=1892852 RepID=A0A5B2XSZ1_9PSEU|nr:hypothetical protein [Solihabitans fulvus]KAA2266576.1 hypothetical protein F0L68_02235 [Solihabitans fulvus]
MEPAAQHGMGPRRGIDGETVRLLPMPGLYLGLGLYLICVAAGGALALAGVLRELWLAILAPAVLAVGLFLVLRRGFGVRLDDAGVTVLRPWRRRTTRWADIGGLVFLHRPSPDSHDTWLVRLAVEPGAGLRRGDIPRHAPGPVLMRLTTVGTDREPPAPGANRELAAQGRIFRELIRRGVPVEERGYVDWVLRATP